MKKVGRDVVVKSVGSGKKTSSGDDVEVSSPASAAVNVIHVSHSEGTSVSTIVRRLEEQLQEAVPPQQQRSNGTVPVRELQVADGSIPSPPPTPNTNSGSNKKSNKLMAKLKKSSGGHAPIDFIMSSPSNFQHNAHVDNDYNWGPDPQKVLKLGAVLGQGAYGQVLEAQYINTNYLMALKIIPTFAAGKNVDDVSREINVLRRCRHPNIVSYYGSATTASELWIMMEYCAHGSLGSIVDTFKAVDKQLNEQQLAYILHQAITGLAYLHNDQIKVIHRDLKCGNILMGEDGIVKLADFGISFQQTGSRSKAATMIGTPLFMSPEMLSGDPYNAKADIWSLGITAIEMADGVPPYFKDHQMRALFRIMHEDPPTLADKQKWSPQFVSFVEACLQKEPSERPSALALLEHEFLRQVKPEETKAVMKSLLSQYEDARREVQRRKAEKNGVGDLCLNFGRGGGGLTTLSTLSTEAPSSLADSASSRAGGSSGLTTLDAPEEVVKLRSLTPRNQVNGNADDESSSSSDGDDESQEAKKKAKAKSSSADGSTTTDDAEDAPAGSGSSKKANKRKSVKADKKSAKRKSLKHVKKNSIDAHSTTANAAAFPATTTLPSKSLSPPVDRRSTLTQMHGNQSSLAFFTGLRQGAQQLLSGAPQAPPSPLPDDGTTAPRTIEEHLRGEDASAAGAAMAAVAAFSGGSSEPSAPPKTMAELARVVGDDLDDYLAMPLVQLIYELHLHKTKQSDASSSNESGSSSSVKTRK